MYKATVLVFLAIQIYETYSFYGTHFQIIYATRLKLSSNYDKNLYLSSRFNHKLKTLSSDLNNGITSTCKMHYFGKFLLN